MAHEKFPALYKTRFNTHFHILSPKIIESYYWILHSISTNKVNNVISYDINKPMKQISKYIRIQTKQHQMKNEKKKINDEHKPNWFFFELFWAKSWSSKEELYRNVYSVFVKNKLLFQPHLLIIYYCNLSVVHYSFM